MYSPIEQPVLDKDDGFLSSKDEQLRRWKEHFSAVLNRVVSYEATPYAHTVILVEAYRLLLPANPKFTL